MEESQPKRRKLHHFFNFEPDCFKSVNSIAIDEQQSKIALLRKTPITKQNCRNFPQCAIEIWNFEFESPFIEQTILDNPKDPSLMEELAWTASGELLSVGLNERLNEYDLDKSCIRKSHQIISGPAYCMKLDKDKRRAAIGTDHGFISIFNLYSSSSKKASFEVNIFKTLRTDSKIFCLDWYENADKNLIVAGTLNQIKLFDLNTCQCVEIIKVPQKLVNVWCLTILPSEKNFIIMSGQSNGQVSFWDGKTCTQITSFPHHTGDVTAVCAKAFGRAYSVGIDGKLCRFHISNEKITMQNRWTHVSKFDLKAIVYSEKLDSLFFGGSDPEFKKADSSAQLVKGFQANLGNSIQAAKDILLYQLQTSLELYQIPAEEQQQPTYLGNIHSNSFITCSGVNGDFVAYATMKKFVLLKWKNQQLTKVKVKSEPSTRIEKITFSDTHLILNTAQQAYVYSLPVEEDEDSEKKLRAKLVQCYEFEKRIFSIHASLTFLAVTLSDKNIKFFKLSKNEEHSSIELDYLPLFCQWKSNSELWFVLPNKTVCTYHARKQKFINNFNLILNSKNENANSKISLNGGFTTKEKISFFYNKSKIWAVKEDTNEVTTINNYTDIVKVQNVGDEGDLYVVEVPLDVMIKNLPPVVYRRKYRLN